MTDAIITKETIIANFFIMVKNMQAFYLYFSNAYYFQ